VEILGYEIHNVRTAVRYLQCLYPVHDIGVLDLHGLVQPELVPDGLGHKGDREGFTARVKRSDRENKIMLWEKTDILRYFLFLIDNIAN